MWKGTAPSFLSPHSLPSLSFEETMFFSYNQLPVNLHSWRVAFGLKFSMLELLLLRQRQREVFLLLPWTGW